MRLLSIVGSLLIAVASSAHGQNASSWSPADPGFRPVNIASSHDGLWVCGVGEAIASSQDGQHWQVKHHVDGGASLLGIRFASATFGYAFGTGGTVVTTTDGGATWSSQKFGTDTIVQAAFADTTHGVIRTRTTLAYLNGDGALHPVQAPSDTLQRFPYTMSLAAITPDKMGVLLSQGQASEAGLLTTVDGGKTWIFNDPPNTGIASFLAVNGSYWASGHEVVDKDKPGGGHGVALAISSSDGREWKHSTNDIHMCQAQTCGVCTVSGCLASDSLLVDFYGDTTTHLPIPKGSLTSKWASFGPHICSVGIALACTPGTEAKELSAAGGPLPPEQIPGPLNSKAFTPSVLTCVLCSITPIFVDDKLEGRVAAQVSFTVNTDGTVDSIDVKGISSPALQTKVHDQVAQWLFEPPMQNGKPLRISTNSTLNITVMRQQ
jgi:hypothetical protein